MSTQTTVASFDTGLGQPRRARHTFEQLDLFAEFEAAEKQRRLDHAPTLFDTGQRGYFARLAVFDQWAQDYGHFASLRRSHAWHAQIGAMRVGGQQPTDACRPTILTADLYCDHYNEDCFCVGDVVYRGACLHCTWEGPLRDGENPATEDAHDHAWPGWRDLPLVPRRPDTATGTQQKKAITRWVQHVNAIYPSGWLESGGPIRTSRGAYGTRHVPNHTGFGGYDMCGDIQPPQASPATGDAADQ